MILRSIIKYFCGPTIKELGEAWLCDKKGELSPSTHSGYRKKLISYYLPRFGNKYARFLSKKDVQKFYNDLISLPSIRGKKLAKITVRNIMMCGESMFMWAIENELIKNDNPFIGVAKQAPLPPVVAYTPELVRQLLALKYPDEERELAVYVAVCTGMRRGELLALCWEDVDLRQRIIRIHREYLYIDGVEYWKETKTGEERIIFINNVLYEKLSNYLQGRKYKEVFRKENGEMLKPYIITSWFCGFLRKNSMPHIKFHGLRKTFGTLLLQSGVDIMTVSRMLGHRSIEVTSKYYLDYVHNMASLAEKMDKIMDN